MIDKKNLAFLTLENGYVQSHLVKCPICSSNDLDEINVDSIGYTACEYDYYCTNCKEIVGHWAYGQVVQE